MGEGLPIFYADAANDEALGHAHLPSARALVLLINDAHAAERVVDAAKRVAPGVPVLMRTRYFAQRERLMKLGANDVVTEELEATVEVLARLLRWLGTPRNVIDERVSAVREETQTSERSPVVPRPTLQERSELADLKIESILIQSGSCAAGCSPIALDLRARSGALVVAVRRGDRLLEQPDPGAAFEVGDVAYLVGSLQSIGAAIQVLGRPAPCEPPASS